MKQEMICIVCPRGCHLSISDTLEISGNLCPRGKTYAETELKNPQRILTTTIRTTFKQCPRISCKTDRPIPKKYLFQAMALINEMVINHPVRMGEVVMENILQTGANVVVTKAYEEGEHN